jgi:hypothetical protein
VAGFIPPGDTHVQRDLLQQRGGDYFFMLEANSKQEAITQLATR